MRLRRRRMGRSSVLLRRLRTKRSHAKLFTAVTEQLGLKLEPTKAAVDFLVIDEIQRPSEN